ncbi:MAG: hypothetical protein ACMUIS_00335 [bacterium]
MLDGSHYFECKCGSDEHTLRFTLDKNDKEIYTSVFLNQYRNVFKRIFVAIKYIFGYKCKYGHWDCWLMRDEDAQNLLKMLNEYLQLTSNQPDLTELGDKSEEPRKPS